MLSKESIKCVTVKLNFQTNKQEPEGSNKGQEFNIHSLSLEKTYMYLSKDIHTQQELSQQWGKDKINLTVQ